jgi:hypothetical protein
MVFGQVEKKPIRGSSEGWKKDMTVKHPERKEKEDGVCVLPRGEELCVWMIAGVVNFKLCNHTPGCSTCLFDEAMRKAWNQKCQDDGV